MIKNIVNRIFDAKADAIGLAVFRMCYAVVLFFEILQLSEFRKIIYDQIPFQYQGEINVTYIFGLWIVALALLFVGFYTRIAALLNCIFGIIIFSSASHFEYHVFYTYVGINFLLLFIPVSRVFSFDSLREKIKYTQTGKAYQINRKVLEINYLMPVFVGIALIYFDSIFLKLGNRLWTSGLGVWLPSSLPMAVWNDTSLLLNQKWLVLFLGYFVLVFEALFIFLFWFKSLRVPLMLIGIFFHIGILITYPIPLFALTFIIVYLLLIPPTFWLWMARKVRFAKPSYTFYYDEKNPLRNKIAVIIRHFDILKAVDCKSISNSNDDASPVFTTNELLAKAHGITTAGETSVGYDAYIQLFKSMVYLYPIGIFLTIPGISFLGRKLYKRLNSDWTSNTPNNLRLRQYEKPLDENQDTLFKGWNRLNITKTGWKITVVVLFALQCVLISGAMPVPIGLTLKKTIGVARHGVFLDYHFKGYNHIFKIVYVDQNGTKTVLPIIDENGMPGDYTSGVIWRHITFNVVTTHISKIKIENEIVPYLKHYFKAQGINGANADFEFFIKTIDTPVNWEKDFLHRQMAKPWVKVGDCHFEQKIALFEWNDTMNALVASEMQ